MKTIFFSFAILAALTLGTAREADAQIVVSIAPPAAYIATSTPEYYEGRPVYFYNNSWYYRDRGRWMYYRHEPSYLYGRRAYWGHGHERVDVRGRDYRGHDYRGGGARYHYRR